MSSTPTPKVSRAPAFPLIWVVPILAVAVGLWMGLRELHDRGPEIVIEFADGSGLEAGKSMLEYKGVSAGLVSGVRLTVRPGNGPPAKWFRGLDKTPPPEISDQGRTFIVKSDQLGSVASGSPVMYRQLKVGQVEATKLSDDATSVLIRIHLEQPYGDLVRTNTRFWNAGGLSFSISLIGAQVKDSSLESLLSGGVAFATPDDGPIAPAAAEGTQFDLAPAAEKAWLKWAPKIPIKAQESSPQSSSKASLLPNLLK